MNTYKDPEYRGYFLGKLGAALVVLMLIAVAVARIRSLATVPAEAPATPAVEPALPSPGAEVTLSLGAEVAGTSALATGAPQTVQSLEPGAIPAAGTEAAPVVGSPVPVAAVTAELARVPTAAQEAAQAPAAGAAQQDVAVSGTVSAPTAAGSTSALSALSTAMGIPSGFETHGVSGGHLMANISINAPSGLEISTEGTTYYSSPTITVSTSSLSPFSTMVGTPSTAQTYTVSGSHLTANISIHAPAGFEISEDGSTYSSSLTLIQSGGAVATTTIYVRLTGAAEGSYAGNITHSSTGALATSAPAAGTPATAVPGAAQVPATGANATSAPEAAQVPETGAVPAAGTAAALQAPGPVPLEAATAEPGVAQAPAPGAASAGGAAATAASGVTQVGAAGELATAPPAPGRLATGAPPTAGAGAPATSGPSAASEGLTISRAVVDETGQVTLTGTGRPGEPIEIIQDGKVIDTIVVEDDGSWSYSYLAAPGVQVLAVQYAGDPDTQSLSFRFESTGTPSGASVTTVKQASPPPPAAAPQATAATSSTPEQHRTGRAYVVQRGDYLRKLALRFYGDEMRWPVIYNATNAMAARDSSFARISDPNLIMPGWKLWIPAQ